MRIVIATLSAFAISIASLMVPAQLAVSQAQPQVCVNGVVPGNPFVQNCNLPPRQPRVRGAAPDAGAIIACRGWPGCLSWYVNGGPPPY